MEALEQAYNTAMEKPLQVLEIFNEFFGEDRVDMQGFPTLEDVRQTRANDVAAIKRYINLRISNNRGFILVHFPHVRVTNEYDRYTDINHLWAKVIIDIEGRIVGRFLLNRSEYTILHFTNNYMHSHISNIPTHNFEDFQLPCTGTGPINNTICSLARDFDADLWRLFCLELDKYVQVESIAGTPYHRLESLVSGGRYLSYPVYTNVGIREVLGNGILIRTSSMRMTTAQLAEFTKYVIDHDVIKVAYQDGAYCLAMSPTEYYIKISNAFIKWYNREARRGHINLTLSNLSAIGILDKYKFSNGKIVRESNGSYLNYQDYVGAKICTFKGADVTLTISDGQARQSESNDIILLRKEIADYIFTKIFNVINFRYGNSKHGDPSPHQKVYFL